ncbi:hypothetical protein DFH09DRAFT_1273363 [Mycena vulgaris]|nr:hypothetical protein DFH09DRAFT_1273363 [Mycena vulgaris]
MGHGHALLALVLKLYLVLLLAQVALSAPFGPGHDPGGTGHPGGTSVGGDMTSKSSSSSFSQPSTRPSSNSAASTVSTASASEFVTTAAEESTSATLLTATSANTTTSMTDASTEESITPTLSDHDSSTVTRSQKTSGSTPTPSPDPQTNAAFPAAPSPQSSEPYIPSSEPTSAATAPVLAVAKAKSKVPIIAGVIVPLVFIIIGAVAFILYKRRQRARDRREWERTHEAIADAVRQVGGPGAGGTPSYAGSGAWSHLDLASRGDLGYAAAHEKGSGDTATDPFIDRPFAQYQHANPTFGAAAYSPYEQVESESRPPSSMDSSIHLDTSHRSHDLGH